MKNKIICIILISIFTIIFKTNFLGLLTLHAGDYPFQYDSEDLAISAIVAEQYNLNNSWVGLGTISDKNFNKYFISEEIYVNKLTGNYTLNFSEYRSQIGLQGIFYTLISNFVHNKYLIEILRWLNSFLLAATLFAICYIIKIKYNFLMALIWGGVFLLSPYIINFSHNLYWVEFTWFIPILLGLISSTDSINFKYKNLFVSIGIFISIFIKCLCGYEYLSTIMIIMIMFLLSDLITNVFNGNISEIKRKLKLLFIISLCSLCGFASAFSLHGYYRGNGNILTGIHDIYQKDILRRTIVGTNNNFISSDTRIMKSIQVPTTKVVIKYFKPYSEKQNLIVKLTGKLFWPLSVVALIIMIFRLYYRKYNPIENIQIMSLFLISLIGTLSWIILAKSHSYIHTHINYVLWFLGYVQMMIYILVSSFIDSRKG